MNGKKIKHFNCYGQTEDCLKCPPEECVRQYCVVDGEEISVSIRLDMKEYHRKYYNEHRKQYFRDYYIKNKDRILAQRKGIKVCQ